MTRAARGVCAAACLPYILLALHRAALLPLAWSDRALSAPQHVAGFNYAVPLSTNWMSHSVVGDSPVQLLEDGRPLPCPNANGSAI